MKIITRTPGEAIRINDDITIVVLPRQEAGGVQLGIIAPRSVKIVRPEILDRPARGKRRL